MSEVVWLVRAGENSRHARRFASGAVIAIGWPNVEGLGDLRGVSEDTILSLLRSSPIVSSPEADAAELVAFRDEMRIGDVVITPDANERDVLVGEITGDYQFLDPSPADDYRHVRSVSWYGRWDRDLLPDHLRLETNYRRTLRRLSNRDEWSNFANTMRDSARSPEDVRRRRTATSTTAVSSDRERVCPGCGLIKSTNQFTGDVCGDCA